MEQESIAGVDPEPTRRTGDGLFKRYLDNEGVINTVAWLRAVGGREVVGSCRVCGHDLLPERPRGRPGSTEPDYSAVCVNTFCAKEYVAPRGRTIAWRNGVGKKRKLPRGQAAISPKAAVGQSAEDAD